MGVANKVWHQKLFTSFTGNVAGSQMPQTINWPTQALQTLLRLVRVSKITEQVAAIMHNTVENLPPVAAGAAAGTYVNIRTRYLMYLPGKYLPLLHVHQLMTKQAFLSINLEAVAQNEQILLGPLIGWLLCVAIMQPSAVEDVMPSMVVRTLPSTLPIMEAGFVEKQQVMAERDLPMWNRTNVMGGTLLGSTPGTGPSTSQAQNAILQSLQVLLQQAQTQGIIPNVTPQRVNKPSEHWEGTIDLLL
jgi:hypothetical protein